MRCVNPTVHLVCDARDPLRGSVWAHEVLGHSRTKHSRKHCDAAGGSRVARIPHSTKGLHVLVTCQDWFLGVAIWVPLLQGLVEWLSP